MPLGVGIGVAGSPISSHMGMYAMANSPPPMYNTGELISPPYHTSMMSAADRVIGMDLSARDPVIFSSIVGRGAFLPQGDYADKFWSL